MGLAALGQALRRKLRAVLAALTLALIAGCAAAPPVPERERAPGADLRLATYNVHYLDLEDRGHGEWGLDDWRERRDAVVQMVRLMRADIVAFQEIEVTGGRPSDAMLWQEWLIGALPEYRAAAAGFGNGVVVGQPVFYRPEKFALLDDGYALFNDPDARFRSIRAFAGYPDAVTWARLRHRASGRALTVFNLHLHFLDAGQRQRSSERVLALAKAAQARGDAVYVIGDFNARRNARPLRLFYENGFWRTRQSGATFHFNTGTHLFGAIDHILHDARSTPVGPSATEGRKLGGIWPSDHYPVWNDFRLKR